MRNVGAIILAAGGSSRFGQPKQLLIFRGESLVRRAARAATDAHCAQVSVVVGDSGEAIKEDLRGSSAAIVQNPDWRRGLGTSIRCGLESLLASKPDLDAVVILACDQPFVESGTITALIAEQKKGAKPVVASRYAKTLGIPVLFDRSRFDALLALPDDSGAKALIESRPNDVASIEFKEGEIDIDTPADFEHLSSKPLRPADNML